jgi:hypothetical protein
MTTRPILLAALCWATVVTTTLTSTGQTKPAMTSSPRFDELVRAEFFAGVAGDTAALDRAMQLIEATLAKDPQRPDVPDRAHRTPGAGSAQRSRGRTAGDSHDPYS